MKIVRFFYTLKIDKEEQNTDTYIIGVTSMNSAIRLAEIFQGVSSAELSAVHYSTNGVCIPSNSDAHHRQFVYDAPVDTQKVRLEAFQRPGEGFGLAYYLTMNFRGKAQRRSMTIPSPRVSIMENAQERQSVFARIESGVKNALQDMSLSMTKATLRSPNLTRKLNDTVSEEWYSLL